MNFAILLQRINVKNTDPIKLKKQIEETAKGSLTSGSIERGWSYKTNHSDTRHTSNKVINEYLITFTNNSLTEQQANDELINQILPVVDKKSETSTWSIISVNDKPYAKTEVVKSGKTHKPYATVLIPDNWNEHFSHIYDRENQISMAMSYLEAAIQSKWVYRPHIAFIGEPGGGKTETARSFKKLLGEDAVLEMDATATTMAGAVKHFKEAQVLPRVLIIEEIEKANFDEFPWLLAVMDPRGEIRKITYRETTIIDTQVLIIAMINNYKLFRTALEGALSSRFSPPIYFPKASRETQSKVLIRDVKNLGGNLDWVEPALDLAEELEITDTRHILAICLAGKDRLLNGEFQKFMISTKLPKEYNQD